VTHGRMHTHIATRPETPMNATRNYEIVLTAQQLATIKVALAAEAEHAHDAARESDDPADAAAMEAAAERNETLWRQLGEVERW